MRLLICQISRRQNDLYDEIRMLIPSLPQVMSCYMEDCSPDEDDAEVDPNVVEEMVENGNPESYKKIAFRKRNEKNGALFVPAAV